MALSPSPFVTCCFRALESRGGDELQGGVEEEDSTVVILVLGTAEQALMDSIWT